MDTFAGKTTLIKCFASLVNRVFGKRKEFAPVGVTPFYSEQNHLLSRAEKKALL